LSKPRFGWRSAACFVAVVSLLLSACAHGDRSFEHTLVVTADALRKAFDHPKGPAIAPSEGAHTDDCFVPRWTRAFEDRFVDEVRASADRPEDRRDNAARLMVLLLVGRSSPTSVGDAKEAITSFTGVDDDVLDYVIAKTLASPPVDGSRQVGTTRLIHVLRAERPSKEATRAGAATSLVANGTLRSSCGVESPAPTAADEIGAWLDVPDRGRFALAVDGFVADVRRIRERITAQ
jgi:hypothetical protein